MRGSHCLSEFESDGKIRQVFETEMAKRLERKHSLATRWLHWVNFPLLAMMIWSGLLIYWANQVYAVRVLGVEIFAFFPQWFYDYLSIPYRLAEGIQIHFFFMWFFTVNGLLYVIYTIVSGEWRSLLPVPASFRRAFRVALHDVHAVSELPPQGKYNDAQRIAYTAIILMGAGSVFTGLAIYKPLQLSWLTSILGGYEWARWEHFYLMIGFVLFFVVHIVQVGLAGWANFRSMISGYDIIDTSPSSGQASSVEGGTG